MRTKQKEEIRSKTLVELTQEVGKRQAEILRLRMEIKMGKTKNTSSARRKADELAVIKTLMQEKRFQNKRV
jgi:ribosomal protein L29